MAMKLSKVALTAAALLLATIASARAPLTLYTSSQEIRAATITANTKLGDFLVTWLQSQAATNEQLLMTQRVSSRGTPIASATSIGNIGVQSSPVEIPVAYNADRSEYLIAYRRAASASIQAGIYGRRVLEDGTALADEYFLFPSNTPTAFGLSTSNTGYLLVVSDDSGIHSVILTFDGSSLPIPRPIIDGNPGSIRNLSLGRLNDSQLLAYDSLTASETQIFSQQLDLSGLPIGTPQGLVQGRGLANAPTVAANSRENEFLVAWADTTAKKPAVFARQILPPNSPTGRVQRLVRNAYAPTLVSIDNSDRTLILWLRGNRQELLGRIFNGQWVPTSSVYRLTARSTSEKPSGSVTPSGEQALVVWTEQQKSAQYRLRLRTLNLSSIAKGLTLQVDSPKVISVSAGSLVTVPVRITVRNPSKQLATGVEITNSFRGRATRGFTSSLNGQCTDGKCLLGDIAPGKAVTVRIEAGIFSSDLGCTPSAGGNLATGPQTITYQGALSWRNDPPKQKPVESTANTSVSCIQ